MKKSIDVDQLFKKKAPPKKEIFNFQKILVVVVWLAILGLLAFLGWLWYFHRQFNLYRDPAYKFSIKYPKAWKVVIHPKPNVAVIFVRPKDTALDSMKENFNVTVQPLPPDIYTVAEFSAAIKKQMMSVFGKTIQIVEDKPIRWGWREGHLMALDAPKPDHLKMVNAWLLRGGQVYILTFLGDMDKYSNDRFYINEMIRSLDLE